MFGYDFDLTAEEQKRHGLARVKVYQETGTSNGWVLNIPENRQLAGDVITVRSNPHYGIEGRPSSKLRFTHSLTDLHNAGRAVKSQRDQIEQETERLRYDVALISLVQQRLDDWQRWSESDRELYSSILKLVSSGHQRALDPAKQAALEQLLGSSEFTDTLGRLNPGMVSWRLPAARARLADRSGRVKNQFATNSQRRAWLNQWQYHEIKRIDQLLDLAAGCEVLAEREEDFLQLARQVRFKPYVQAVNRAWYNLERPQSARELVQSLAVFGGLYGTLMRPMSIIANTAIKDLRRCSEDELTNYIELARTLELLLPQMAINSAYRELVGQLSAFSAATVSQLQAADFGAAIKSAAAYRFCLRYHGVGQTDWRHWYLKKGMEWLSSLPKDFDPLRGLP